MRIRSDLCIQPANGIYTIVFYSDLVDLHIYIFNIAPLGMVQSRWFTMNKAWNILVNPSLQAVRPFYVVIVIAIIIIDIVIVNTCNRQYGNHWYSCCKLW